MEQLGSRSRTEREGAERALSLLGFEAIQELAKGTQSPDASIRKSCEKLFEQAWRPSAISQRLDEGNKLSLEMHNNKPNLTDKVYKLMSQIAETMDHPAGRGKYKQERLRQLDVVENLDQTGQVKLPRWQLDALRKERETLTNPDSEIKRVNANTKLHIAKALIWGGDSTTAKRYLLDAASKCPDVANSDEFLVKVIEGGLQHDKDFLAEFTRKGGSLDSLKTALAWVQPIPNDHPDGPRAPRRKK